MLAEAQKEAEGIVSDAEQAAARLDADAEDRARQVEERAQRRLDEAESGARILRERVAEEVTRSQRTAQDELRNAREQTVAHVVEARREADAIRASARTMLEDARQEVAVLSRRRDEIAAELGQLSGVIQALAVPTGTELPTQYATQDAGRTTWHGTDSNEDDQR